MFGPVRPAAKRRGLPFTMVPGDRQHQHMRCCASGGDETDSGTVGSHGRRPGALLSCHHHVQRLLVRGGGVDAHPSHELDEREIMYGQAPM
jgi:hypothetical protein